MADRIRQLSARKPLVDPEAAPVRTTEERSARQPMFRQGVVILGAGQRLSVVIKNLSTTGARIEFFVRTALPGEVLLTEATLKLSRRARVVWQSDGAAGLQFIER